MTVFLPALLWGICVLAALAGWGRLLAFVLRRDRGMSREVLADWLEAPAWGIAVSCVLGGLLNLFALANYAGAYVLAGLGLFAFALRAAIPRVGRELALIPRWRFTLPALVLLVLLLRFAASVIVVSFSADPGWSTYRFNPQDDAQSYVVSVVRLVQTGSLGLDPYNSRQAMSSLGAQHFLNALVASVLPLDHLHMVEGGIGLTAWCLATTGLGLRLGLRRLAAIALMLIPLVVAPAYTNVTSTATASAVLTALISCLLSETSGVFLAGVLLGGACSLKTTVIPLAVVFVIAAAGWRACARRPGKPLARGAVVGLVAFVAMIPWMVWQYRATGTPLYPLLGRGMYASVYFPFPSVRSAAFTFDLVTSGLTLPGSLLLLILMALSVRKIRRAAGPATGVVIAFLVAWIAHWLALILAIENLGAARYVAVTRGVGLTLFAAAAWRVGQQLAREPATRFARFTGPAILTITLLGLWPEWSQTYFQVVPRDLAASVRGQRLDWATPTKLAAAQQSAIPPGEPFLAYLAAPYLLDFRRNPVFVVDWPGETSPPPGLPVKAGAEAVAQYLHGQGLRYVAYDYENQANFPRRLYENYLYFDFSRMVRFTTLNAFAFQDDLAELGRTRRAIYDDGHAFVLDLDHRRENPPASLSH